MELFGQRVSERADNVLSRLGVVVNIVLGAEHALSFCDADNDGDPFACGRAVGRGGIDAVELEPIVDGIDGGRVGRGERLDFFFGQVLPISGRMV